MDKKGSILYQLSYNGLLLLKIVHCSYKKISIYHILNALGKKSDLSAG